MATESEGVVPQAGGDDQARRLLHELQVHQVELAQQTEALQDARNEAAAGLQRYADLYESAPSGLVTVDAQGLVMEVNARGRELLSNTGLALVGRSILECVAERSKAVLWRVIAESPHNPSFPAFQVHLRQGGKPDTVALVESRANPRDNASVLLALTDVTARHRAEAELQRTREILELSNRISRTGFWEYDQGTDCLTLSAMSRELLEVEPEFHATLAFATGKFKEGESRSRVAGAFAAALDPGHGFDLELQVTTRSGRDVWTRFIGIPETGEGRGRRIYGTLQDIDTRMQAEMDRLEMARAEAASRAKSSFLARMSHELRTPLNAVLGFSQLLQLDPSCQSRPDQMRKLDHIRSAGLHLLALIDEVLDLARIESGGMRLALRPIDLPALLAECVELTSELAARRQVTVRIDRHDPALRAIGDTTRTSQVLMNLLTNAVKYNHAGGSVQVSCAADEAWVSVAIRDTGRGMTPEQVASLYEPFNRLGAEHSGVEGTGLGLVIARQLVQAMGGRLEVHSERGQGSLFTMRLPRLEDAGEAHGMALTGPIDLDPQAPTGPFQVVYVEDDAASAALVRDILELRPGVKVELANDALNGLAAARRRHPDLLLLDMNLPGGSGQWVLEQLKADAAMAAIPCIAVSANAMGPDIDRALQAGFVDYLVKPVGVRQLLALVDRFRV